MLEGVGGKGENRTHTSGFADRLTTTVDLPMNPHKTRPVREGSIPKNFYHVIGGELLLQQYRWWALLDLNQQRTAYEAVALPLN